MAYLSITLKNCIRIPCFWTVIFKFQKPPGMYQNKIVALFQNNLCRLSGVLTLERFLKVWAPVCISRGGVWHFTLESGRMLISVEWKDGMT